MQQHYQKSIHHICTLILNTHYKRAHNLLTYLIKQGFTNTEVYVMLSYCTKMISGISAGVNVLKEVKEGKCGKMGMGMEGKGKGDGGMLVDMVLAQYYEELDEKRKCLGVIENIEAPSQEQITQKPTILSSVTQSLQISLQSNKKPPPYQPNHPQFDTQALNELNSLVQIYKNKQEPLPTILQKFQELLLTRNLTGKLKDIVSRYVRYVDYQIKGKC